MARSRRLLTIIVVLACALLVLVALAPTIIALGPGRGIVASAVSANIDGDAEVDAVRFSWFGGQSVRGMRVTERSGREAANVDVTVDAGLFALALGSAGALDVTITGAVHGDLHEDGTTSFQQLLAAADDGAAGDAPSSADPGAATPLRLDGVPAVRLGIDGLAVTIVPVGDDDPTPIVLDGLTGHLAYAPGGSTEVVLASATTSGAGAGRVEVDVRATRLFDERGTLTVDGAALNAKVTLGNVPVPFADQVEELTAFTLSAVATDLASVVDVEVNLETKATGAAPSRLEGTLALDAPLAPDGSVRVGLDRIRGALTGRAVPTALAQPLLASTPLLLTRDVGSAVDLTARFAPDDRADVLSNVNVDVKSAHATLELTATVRADRAIEGGRLKAGIDVHPDLLAAVAGTSIAGATRLEVDVASFSVPAPADDGAVALADAAINGQIIVAAPLTVAVAEGETLAVRDAALVIDTAALRDGIRVGGGAAVDDGRLDVDMTVTGLVDATGALALANAEPIGTITVTGIDGARVAALVAGDDPEGATAAAATALLAGSIRASVETVSADGGLDAVLTFATDALDVSARAARRGDVVRVAETRVTTTITPDLAAALQGESEKPVTLTAPAPVTLTVAPFALERGDDGAYGLGAEPITAEVTIAAIGVAHEELASPVTLRDVRTTVDADLAAKSYKATGSAAMAADDGAMAQASWDLAARDVDGEIHPSGTLTLADVDMHRLERTLGLEPRALVGWVGGAGGLSVEMTDLDARRAATVRCDLARLTGVLTAALADDVLELSAESITLLARKDAIARVLNPPPEDGSTPTSVIGVAEDVPFTAAVRDTRIPLALARDEPVDPESFALDAELTGGALVLVDDAGAFSTIDGLVVTTRSEDLRRGVDFTLKSAASSREAEDGGTFDVEGRVYRLLDEAGALQAEKLRIDADAKAAAVPTAIADTFFGFDGLLVAAVGAEMGATVEARGFSRKEGWLDARVDTPNGFLTGRIKSRGDIVYTDTELPLNGSLELTPAFRQRLLQRIHPVFADVETTEQPVVFNVPTAAQVPVNGDLARLNADLEITIGAVQFRTGSTLFDLLAAFESQRETIPGFIEPIVVKVRSGVLTYDRFALRIEKYTLNYEGTVDLVRRTVDLRTEIPLEGLAQTFGELKGYVDDIIVPLVTRGPLDAPETEIDPDFDLAGAAAQAGFRGVIDEELGKEIGGLLDDIFGNKKKEEE
jgi:hypothetical protein